jgi:hypothetical protein
MKFANATANAEADAVARRLDGGTLRLYQGVAPETADAPARDQRLLAELRFSNPSANPAIGGVVALGLVPDEDAKDTGRADWFRALDAEGFPVMDGVIGEDLMLNVSTIQIHARVSAEGMLLSVAKE